MSSVLQALFALLPFQQRYSAPNAVQHWSECGEPLPASCLECQMYKIADGLVSGRYSRPRRTDADTALQNPLAGVAGASAAVTTTPQPVFQEGIRPITFKTLIGRRHVEFATMRQQDAEEFFTHLLTSLRRRTRPHPRGGGGGDESPPGTEPTETFAYALERRLQCTACAGVRYRVDPHDVLSVPVPAREKGRDEEGKVVYADVALTECVDAVMAVEDLEYKCPNCRKDVKATQ